MKPIKMNNSQKEALNTLKEGKRSIRPLFPERYFFWQDRGLCGESRISARAS